MNEQPGLLQHILLESPSALRACMHITSASLQTGTCIGGRGEDASHRAIKSRALWRPHIMLHETLRHVVVLLSPSPERVLQIA